jgi:hypothetical protein
MHYCFTDLVIVDCIIIGQIGQIFSGTQKPKLSQGIFNITGRRKPQFITKFPQFFVGLQLQFTLADMSRYHARDQKVRGTFFLCDINNLHDIHFLHAIIKFMGILGCQKAKNAPNWLV